MQLSNESSLLLNCFQLHFTGVYFDLSLFGRTSSREKNSTFFKGQQNVSVSQFFVV